MKAMILAAGLGDRLHPFTQDTPKPLLSVGKYSLIERAINKLIEHGCTIVSGGTKNHMFLVDLTAQNISGKDAEAALGKANITVNKNTIPNDSRGPFITSGIRIGTPAITTRGFGRGEVEELANLVAMILGDINNQDLLDSAANQVAALCERFPVYKL